MPAKLRLELESNIGDLPFPIKFSQEDAIKKEAEEKARQEKAREAREEAEKIARLEEEKAREGAEKKARMEEEERKKKELTLELAPGVTMEFVRVPAGDFLMGSDPMKDEQARSNEQPQHKVNLDEYLIGKYPITNHQFQAFVIASGYKTNAEEQGRANGWTGSATGNAWVMIQNASWQQPRGQGSELSQKEEHPVVCYLEGCCCFLRVSQRVSGKKLRLPSEAEWEKAARGTDGRLYPWGDQALDATYYNFKGNEGGTTLVGQYNLLGDKAGNVWEWVNDWNDRNYYKNSPVSNLVGPASGQYQLIPCSSWFINENFLRSAGHGYNALVGSSSSLGFRCARGTSP